MKCAKENYAPTEAFYLLCQRRRLEKRLALVESKWKSKSEYFEPNHLFVGEELHLGFDIAIEKRTVS